MGVVYLGRSRGGREVAVKVVSSELSADDQFRRRFEREVAAARRVGGFYTAAVVDADTGADRPWMATSYIPGPTLQVAVDAQGPFTVKAVRAIGAGLAEGLATIHAAGLVHRDLKPANIVVAADGPRVIDFGITRALDSASVTTSRAFLGTPAYMPPEQALGEEVTAAGDVFSLGGVLAFAATGRSPSATAGWRRWSTGWCMPSRTWPPYRRSCGASWPRASPRPLPLGRVLTRSWRPWPTVTRRAGRGSPDRSRR
jgi:serine/threonine protein kinase